MDEVSSSADSGASARRTSVQSAPRRPAPKAERAEAPERTRNDRSEKTDEKRTERAEQPERPERLQPAPQLQSPAPELSLNVANTLTQNAAEARIRALTIDVNV